MMWKRVEDGLPIAGTECIVCHVDDSGFKPETPEVDYTEICCDTGTTYWANGGDEWTHFIIIPPTPKYSVVPDKYTKGAIEELRKSLNEE